MPSELDEIRKELERLHARRFGNTDSDDGEPGGVREPRRPITPPMGPGFARGYPTTSDLSPSLLGSAAALASFSSLR
jgi:hypothetical protein